MYVLKQSCCSVEQTEEEEQEWKQREWVRSLGANEEPEMRMDQDQTYSNKGSEKQ